MSGEVPGFLARSGLARDAYRFAQDSHRGQLRKGDDSPYIRHPVEVARLLHGAGVRDEVVLAAALLHDVVEDTEVGLDELRDRFGDAVAELVGGMTEDKSIEPYRARKEHHREQVADTGPRAVRIYAADKLANVRAMRAVYSVEGERAARRFNAPIDERFALWRGDLELAEHAIPDLELVGELRSELDAFAADRALQVAR